MENKEDSKLYWVSVGGNPCEPARLNDGKIYTIGCADGTKYEEGCGIELVKEIFTKRIPATPIEQKKLDRAWRKRQSKNHGYRKFV